MSANLGIGSIIEGNVWERDAIHVAVLPVIAGERLYPGTKVIFLDNTSTTVIEADNTEEPVGVVDPFLPWGVLEGQRVWLFLNPGSITTLRHVWTHPEVDTIPVMASVEWIRDFANNLSLSYAELMLGARYWIVEGDRLTRGSNLEGQSVPPEFWAHYQAVTGKVVPAEAQQNFFSCSC